LSKTIDGEEVENLEIYYTKRYFGWLEKTDFDTWGVRRIKYDCGDRHNFEIEQHGGANGRNDTMPVYTLFKRDEELHRIDGPARIVHFQPEKGSREYNAIKQMSKLPCYYLGGKEWTKCEFDFFIRGIALQ